MKTPISFSVALVLSILSASALAKPNVGERLEDALAGPAAVSAGTAITPLGFTLAIPAISALSPIELTALSLGADGEIFKMNVAVEARAYADALVRNEEAVVGRNLRRAIDDCRKADHRLSDDQIILAIVGATHVQTAETLSPSSR